MLRRLYWRKVVGSISSRFAGSTSLSEMLALGTKGVSLGVSKIEMNENVSGRFADWKKENSTHIYF